MVPVSAPDRLTGFAFRNLGGNLLRNEGGIGNVTQLNIIGIKGAEMKMGVIEPGNNEPSAGSITLVEPSAMNDLISSVLPTAMIFSPMTATASAMGFLSSTVRTLPLMIARSALDLSEHDEMNESRTKMKARPDIRMSDLLFLIPKYMKIFYYGLNSE